MPPDRPVSDDLILHRALAAVIRRTWTERALIGSATALVVIGLTSSLVGRTGLFVPAAVSIAAIVAALVMWRGSPNCTAAAAARRIERFDSEACNVVITAAELAEHPERIAAWMRTRVIADAAARVSRVEPRLVVPLTRPLIVWAAAACVCAVLVAGWPRGAGHAVRRTVVGLSARGGIDPSGATRVVAQLTPPPYIGGTPREIVNPERLEALQGTALRLKVSGRAGPWRIRFGPHAVDTVQRDAETIADIVLTDSGYFAIEPVEGPAHARRLLPIAVSQDRTPTIRIGTPGKDLLLPDATTRVPVVATASDDFGLRSLELRYTKVSGTGEQFEFEEGVLPVALTRRTDREWQAATQIAVAALKLEPGDSLVYRAVGRDQRAGDAGLAASDTYFIEIAGPGQVALDGVEMPADRDRYALSQQMIVLKIERLRAREETLTERALIDHAADIAAEQRAVRSNFVFLMGGHVEDEEVEAEQSSEILEGRLQSGARKDITAAIRFMGRAEGELMAVSTSRALPPARAAVDALQRAFGRNRYILRTMPVRSRINPSRRLSGDLSTAADWQRDVQPANLDPGTILARVLVSGVLDFAAGLQAERALDAAALTRLAEQALSVDAGATDWQLIAARLISARDAAAAGQPRANVTRRLNEAVRLLIARAAKGARPAGIAATGAPGSLLSAWAEATRK